MANVGDIFSFVASWRHDNGQMANLSRHYKLTAKGSQTGDTSRLNTVVGNDIEAIIGPNIHSNWTPLSSFCQNLMDATDFNERGLDYESGIVGGGLPSFLAVGFRSFKQSEGHNRGRANLPLFGNLNIEDDGGLPEGVLELCEPIAAYLGASAASASGEIWRPITVKYTYVNGVRTGVEERSDLVGLWQIDQQFTTVKSRQAYIWTSID